MSILEKENFRKYLLYALGEIVLVVFGILIALQISNVNQNQKDRREEQRILSNFKTDLAKDIAHFNQNILQTEARQRDMDSIFAILYEPDKYSAEEFINYNLSMPYNDIIVPNSGTFDESIASGTINFIRNDNLREGIFEYYRMINVGGTSEVLGRLMNQSILPGLSEILLTTREGMSLYGIQSNLEGVRLNELSRNKKYYNLVLQKYTAQPNQIQEWNRLIELATDLDRIVGEELDKF